LRALLLGALGTTGADPDVRAEAARRFDIALGGGPPLDPDLEAAVLRTVADQCRAGDFEVVLERYRHPNTPQEEQRYLMALAAFPDVELSVRTFDLARTEVRTQNAPYLVGALFANRVGGPAVWQRVQAEWDGLLARFPQNSHSRMLDGVRWLCGDRDLAAGVGRFLAGHPVRTGQRSVTQAVEQLEVNVRFGEHQREGGRLAGALGAAAGA
jgi:puromycin-sensitive aminopeptidase